MNDTNTTYTDPWTYNSPWRVKIDYLALTYGGFHVPVLRETANEPTYETRAARALSATTMPSNPLLALEYWTPSAGRSGYSRSEQHTNGARFYTGHASAPPLLELGGAACDDMQESGTLKWLIENCTDGVTRLDLAGDLTCVVSPATFVNAGFSRLYASTGRAASATGETEYIGSPTSDRRCRVYRYAPPHPRADALRVEVVLRRELARSAAQELISRPASEVWSAACSTFQFKHPSWRTPSTSKLPRLTMKNEPTNASRLQWLTKQIKPAVLEAHRTGLIDLTKWLSEL